MTERHVPKRVFTYDEAVATFPFVRDLTQVAVRQLEALVNSIGSRDELDSRRAELEEARETIVQNWAERVLALGCEVKGLWLVDWDSGDGYYCWRFPEDSLGYFHSYEEGFSGRLPLN